MTGLIMAVFVTGYLAIALEHSLKINKAATALVTGIVCWTIFILTSGDAERVAEELSHHLGTLSQILFFLLGAIAR